MRLGIVMPVRNCLEYTQQAIESIKTFYHYDLVVIDDHSDQPMKDWLLEEVELIPEMGLITDPKTSGVAANWNLGIRKLIEFSDCDTFLVLNNDILLHPQTIDNLVERLNEGDVIMVTGTNVAQYATPDKIFNYPITDYSESEHPDFSCFLINKHFIEKIGWFDENFIGAYMEDCDAHARIVLAGEIAVACNSAPYYHYSSRTLQENPRLAEQIHENHLKNQRYFAKKWGVSHVNDVEKMREVYYKHPFDDESKSIKDW